MKQLASSIVREPRCAGFSPASAVPLLVQRKCACGGRAGSGGAECAECRRKKLLGKRPALLQPRLAINQPGDKYEREADRIAGEVVAEPGIDRLGGPSPGDPPANSIPRISLLLQRNAGAEIPDEERIRTGQIPGDTPVHSVAGIVTATLRHPGRPLDQQVRNQMEARFGRDLEAVRIHTGVDAGCSAEELNARAYTVGPDIVFAPGQYAPATGPGKWLLAHELVHTIQQGNSAAFVQRDFAVEPTTPNRSVPTLTAAQMASALAFNRARHTDPQEIALLRDILGIAENPAVIDEDFVNAVVRYQAEFGLTRDGRLGRDTADRLAREIIATAEFMGPGNLGDVAPEFALETAIRNLINANNRTYADYRAAIDAATMLQQHVALLNQQLLTDLKGQLSWNNWARCIELLGRRAPTADEMLANRTVLAAINAAWTASTPGITRWDTAAPAHPLAATCDPIPGAAAPAAHEEGGWIYINLITGDLSTRGAAAGGQAGLDLTTPPTVANSILVGYFHTHPNVGACWGAVAASGRDITLAAGRGVPDLIRGAFPALANVANVTTGPQRAHLAGSRLFPGAAGGLAPQADILGREGVLE